VRDAYVATKRRVREQTLANLRNALELDIADWKKRS
jgi:hypothetical protein